MKSVLALTLSLFINSFFVPQALALSTPVQPALPGVQPSAGLSAQLMDTDPAVCSEENIAAFIIEELQILTAMGTPILTKHWTQVATPATGTRHMYKWISKFDDRQTGQICASCYATFAREEPYAVDTTGAYATGEGLDDCSDYYVPSL